MFCKFAEHPAFAEVVKKYRLNRPGSDSKSAIVYYFPRMREDTSEGAADRKAAVRDASREAARAAVRALQEFFETKNYKTVFTAMYFFAYAACAGTSCEEFHELAPIEDLYKLYIYLPSTRDSYLADVVGARALRDLAQRGLCEPQCFDEFKDHIEAGDELSLSEAALLAGDLAKSMVAAIVAKKSPCDAIVTLKRVEQDSKQSALLASSSVVAQARQILLRKLYHAYQAAQDACDREKAKSVGDREQAAALELGHY